MKDLFFDLEDIVETFRLGLELQSKTPIPKEAVLNLTFGEALRLDKAAFQRIVESVKNSRRVH